METDQRQIVEEYPPEIVDEAPTQQLITEDFVERFEKAAQLYQNRYLPACLKLTNEADWVMMGQKYYLQSTGAEKLCSPLGITWERPIVHKNQRQDDQGGFYEYEVEGIVKCGFLKRYGWFTGNCDSRDSFFVARGPVIEGDIRKSAFSNFLVNAVTRLAGIRNPTKEMLIKAGLNVEAIVKPDFSKNKSPEESRQIISEAQGKRLWAIAKGKGVDETTLREIAGREPWKYASLRDITRGHYDAIVKAVESYQPQTNGEDGQHA